MHVSLAEVKAGLEVGAVFYCTFSLSSTRSLSVYLRIRVCLPPRFQSGKYVQGVLRVSPSLKRCEAYVVVPGFQRDVLVTGIGARNRGFDGDVVVVELADKAQWQAIEAAQYVSSLAQPTAFPPAEAESESESDEEEELAEIARQLEKIDVAEAVKLDEAAEDLDVEEVSDTDSEDEQGVVDKGDEETTESEGVNEEQEGKEREEEEEEEEVAEQEEEEKEEQVGTALNPENGQTREGKLEVEAVVVPLASALLGTTSEPPTGLVLPVAETISSPAALSSSLPSAASVLAAQPAAAIGTATPSAPKAESVAGVQTLQTGGFSKCTVLRPVGKVVYILEANHQVSTEPTDCLPLLLLASVLFLLLLLLLSLCYPTT